MSSDDPLARKLKEAAARIKDERDVTEGERRITADFAERARQAAPDEFRKLEQLFRERCDSINAGKPPTPALSYEDVSHRVTASKYAIELMPFAQLHDFELRIAVGLHPNAYMSVVELPDIDTVHLRFTASADENGFFWYN